MERVTRPSPPSSSSEGPDHLTRFRSRPLSITERKTLGREIAKSRKNPNAAWVSKESFHLPPSSEDGETCPPLPLSTRGPSPVATVETTPRSPRKRSMRKSEAVEARGIPSRTRSQAPTSSLPAMDFTASLQVDLHRRAKHGRASVGRLPEDHMEAAASLIELVPPTPTPVLPMHFTPLPAELPPVAATPAMLQNEVERYLSQQMRTTSGQRTPETGANGIGKVTPGLTMNLRPQMARGDGRSLEVVGVGPSPIDRFI